MSSELVIGMLPSSISDTWQRYKYDLFIRTAASAGKSASGISVLQSSELFVIDVSPLTSCSMLAAIFAVKWGVAIHRWNRYLYHQRAFGMTSGKIRSFLNGLLPLMAFQYLYSGHASLSFIQSRHIGTACRLSGTVAVKEVLVVLLNYCRQELFLTLFYQACFLD